MGRAVHQQVDDEATSARSALLPDVAILYVLAQLDVREDRQGPVLLLREVQGLWRDGALGGGGLLFLGPQG